MFSNKESRRHYWEKFLAIKRAVDDIDPAAKCDYWLFWYKQYCEKIRSSEDRSQEEKSKMIVLGHVLLHPDFCTDRKDVNFRDKLDSRRSMVVREDERKGECQLGQIIGEECIFNQYPEYRGDLAGDHIWPYSLGGPSNERHYLTRNRAMLCKSCNSAKSSSILAYHWKEHEWMDLRLHKIARRMRVE